MVAPGDESWGEAQYWQSVPAEEEYMCDGQLMQSVEASLPVLGVHSSDEA